MLQQKVRRGAASPLISALSVILTGFFFTCYTELLLNSKICGQPAELLIERLKRVQTASQSAADKTTLGPAFHRDSLYHAGPGASAKRHAGTKKHLAVSRLVLTVRKEKEKSFVSLQRQTQVSLRRQTFRFDMAKGASHLGGSCACAPFKGWVRRRRSAETA